MELDYDELLMICVWICSFKVGFVDVVVLFIFKCNGVEFYLWYKFCICSVRLFRYDFGIFGNFLDV